ncbi:unnamed protein product [Rotaria sp. Silwood2]|nr:unnamed protein product [Rotaria sp. Silwood2]CAF2528121.1 unnamed protein product [Rotaria sp. Silwood2]CAF2760356.1 unnamed protein product [Rotaria sp. Silwood2]CAF2938192.1 unnamed protein product [Rotaria sp. Silwood2]CAF3853418.1 unnamed protein product [Rotaria sp. Silwood2]
MAKDLSTIPWVNTLRDSNDILPTTSTFSLPSTLDSEPMDIDVEHRQSIIRSTEADHLQARFNNSSNHNRAIYKPLMKSIIRPAENDDENPSLEQKEQISNGSLINDNNLILEASGYDPARLAEVDSDAEFALRLQQEEYERDSFMPNRNPLFPFQVQEDDESPIENPHPLLDTSERHFESDEQYAAYLQEQERQSSQRYHRQAPPYIQFRSQSNPESSETPETNESNAEPIRPFFRIPQRPSSNADDDSDEDSPYGAMTNPFLQFLATQGRPLPQEFASIFPGFRPRGYRRTRNLQETEEDFGPEDYERLLQLDDTIHKKKLTEHQINSIPQEKFIPNSHNTDEENKCSVCLELFENRQTVRRFPCNHLYHKECADRWLQENNVCPICREPPIRSSSTNQRHPRSFNNTRRPTYNSRPFGNRNHNNNNNNNNNNNSTAHNNNNHRRGQAPQRQS